MRIAIVNPAETACEALRRIVSLSHDVAWVAKNGRDAVDLAASDRPDLVLMELVMPVMDGVQATREIMARSPCAILVVTATVEGNASRAFEAMGYGALDAVNTPSLGSGAISGGAALLAKIDTIRRLLGRGAGLAGPASSGAPVLVLIGASAGGPKALAELLGNLPEDVPAALVIAQHVDAEFASGLAAWLDALTRLQVRIAVAGDRPDMGCALLASSGQHLVVASDGTLRYVSEPRTAPPSIDVLFESARHNWPTPGIAVLLTGMGRDGAIGLRALRGAGWHTIAQDEASSVVGSMPMAAVELGAVVEQLPLGQIAPVMRAAIARLLQAGRELRR